MVSSDRDPPRSFSPPRETIRGSRARVNARRVARTPRRGAMLVEVVAALAILIAVIAAIAQLLVISAGQRRATRLREVATREAGNLMERIMARPWNVPNRDEVARIELSRHASRQLPRPWLEVTVAPLETEPASRGEEIVLGQSVRILIGWRGRSGMPAEPVELVGWKFVSRAANE